MGKPNSFEEVAVDRLGSSKLDSFEEEDGAAEPTPTSTTRTSKLDNFEEEDGAAEPTPTSTTRTSKLDGFEAEAGAAEPTPTTTREYSAEHRNKIAGRSGEASLPRRNNNLSRRPESSLVEEGKDDDG